MTVKTRGLFRGQSLTRLNDLTVSIRTQHRRLSQGVEAQKVIQGVCSFKNN